MGFCARPTDVSSRSKFSKAIPVIHRQSAIRSQSSRAFRSHQHRDGRRPRDDHRCAHQRRPQAGRDRLDHRTESPVDTAACRRRWPLACSCRCSTSAILPRSKAPSCSRASASSSARILLSPRNAGATELLDATEQDLKDIQKRITRERNPLRGASDIGLAVGAVISRRKVGKHFELTIRSPRPGRQRKS
jgi:hypothetical protein